MKLKPTDWRLLLCAALFVAWIGYLGVLVASRPVTSVGWPLVVSRPQILASSVDVIAEINDPNEEATILEVLWPREGAPLKAGDKLKIGHIDDCAPLSPTSKVPPRDFSGPGRYLVPLRKATPIEGQKGPAYEVAPIPPSPGLVGINAVRIYPDTSESRAQYQSIRKPGSDE